jgi:hypothetical protein
VTVSAAARHAALRILASRYRRLRTAHPVTVLRWLRNGALLCVLATALMYVWVATQAGSDIAAARRTSQAVADIGGARADAARADRALGSAFSTEDVTLTGTGTAYVNDVNEVGSDLTLAAEGNAAGQEGTSSIQFVQALLQTYLSLSENAVSDYGAGGALVPAAEGYASGGEQELARALTTLRRTEMTAFRAQRGAWPLDPAVSWWALLGPVAGLALLTIATAHVLARYFRRHVSRWLWGSLLVTAATAVAAGVLNWNDERHLSADPWAGHPATLTCALLLFLLAAAAALLAYRPRLAEYRFESS